MNVEQLHAEKMLLLQALNDSRRIGAIKAVRAITGAGLMEAKTVIDAVFDSMVGVPAPAYRSAADYIPDPKEETIMILEDGRAVEHLSYTGALSDAINMAEGTVKRDECIHVQVFRLIAESKTVTTHTLKMV
jgi:hypothetical protein